MAVDTLDEFAPRGVWSLPLCPVYCPILGSFPLPGACEYIVSPSFGGGAALAVNCRDETDPTE